MTVLMFLLSLSSADASTAQNGVISSGFREGYYSVGAETTYLSTSANYTSKGTSLDFDDQYGYSAIQTLIYGRYDFSDELSSFFDLPLNYAMSENPTDKYSSFKAAGIAVGANYDLKISSFAIIPQIKGYFAVEKFDTGSEDILTSDGVNYIDVGSHIFKNFSSLQFHGYLSYQYRFDGFSGLLNYQSDLGYKTESTSFTFGVKGFQTITEDTGNATTKHGYLAIVNGGSLAYGSFDPSRTDLFAQAKWTLEQSLDVYGSVNKSIRGENSGDIMTFTVGLEYFFQPSGGSSREKYESKPTQDDFSYDDEKIDPKIEEEIKNYNKPKKKPKRVAPPKTRTVSPPSAKNGLELSKKQLGKKTTSTSPIQAKPKSKKPKRVNIDF